jgi:hypothetical protein
MSVLNGISFYFESEVSSEISAVESFRQTRIGRSDVSNAESRIEANTLARSQTRLVAVRYAEDFYVNPVTRAWETVAYIDREEAWRLYETEAAKVRDILLSLSGAAEAENEAFL